MSTGYTAPIYDGEDIDFVAFAMRCSRAFGMLISMRDDAPDAEIPDPFEPSSYHAERLAEAEARRKKLLVVTDEQAAILANEAYKAALTRYRESASESANARRRYELMLSEVNAWQPPTPDHENMKTFMRDQITESIMFDCVVIDAPTRLPGAIWHHKELERVERDIEHCKREHNAEVDRAAKQTIWVQELRASLTAHSNVDS